MSAAATTTPVAEILEVYRERSREICSSGEQVELDRELLNNLKVTALVRTLRMELTALVEQRNTGTTTISRDERIARLAAVLAEVQP